MASYGKAKSEAMDRAKPRPKVLESIEVKRSANGGFIARHRFDNSGPSMAGYHEPEEHTFGKDQHGQLMSHLKEHLGIKKAAKAAADDEDGDE